MTFEWIDPNLAWTVKERQLNTKNAPSQENESKGNLFRLYRFEVLFVATGSSEIPETDTIRSIRVDREKVWVPEIEVINRVYDFSPVDEIKRKLRIESEGKITFNRMYRLRTMMSSQIQRYPYDIQVIVPTYKAFKVQ